MTTPTYRSCPKCRQQVYTADPFCPHCGNQYPPVAPMHYAPTAPPSILQPTAPPAITRQPAVAPPDNANLRWRELSGDQKYYILFMWLTCGASVLWAADFALHGQVELSPRNAIAAIIGIFIASALQNEPAKIAKIHGRFALGAFAGALLLVIVGFCHH